MKKKTIVFGVLLLILAISVGFALLTTTLNIEGNTTAKGNTWNIYFDNIQVKTGSITPVQAATINPDNKTQLSFNVNLNLPGDFYEFDVDVKNDGTLDAMIDTFEILPVLTTEQEKIFDYTVNYSNGSSLKQKDLLASKTKETLTVRIEFNKDVSDEDLSSSNTTISPSVTVNYIQATSEAKKVEVVQPWDIISGDGTQVGDIIALGNEQFYIIKNESNQITAFAKYVVNHGYSGLQDSSISGYLNGATPFASSYYNIIGNPPNSYEGSLVQKLVNDYVGVLRTMYPNVEISGRLITKEELEGLGCTSLEFGTCENAPNWVGNLNYWTQTPDVDVYPGGENVWAVYSPEEEGRNSVFYSDGYADDTYAGLRPVIIFNKK